MLKKGTGIQSQFDANLPFTMVGVPNAPWTPTAILSMLIDPSQGGIDFIPGETWVSRNDQGLIIRGIAPNSNLFGLVMRGASQESIGEAASVFRYEDKGPVPVGTVVTTWINVITAPTAVESNGIAINDETGQATAYDNSATAGFFTCGETGADLAAWKAVTDGSLSVTPDGGVPQVITALNFSAATSLDDVAEVIEAALTGTFVNYNTAENLFVFTSKTESGTSAIALAADATGTSIYVAGFLNGPGGAATAGTAAGSPPAGFTAATKVKIKRWAASNPLKVEVAFPNDGLE
ncbi:DUF3383 family protein [Candidatus Pacearchaeota archaeon]|nr:DUF3383 family protein [Candidatus Pacearchaeota archaeon]